MSTLTVAGKTQAEKIRLMLTAAPALTPQTWATVLNPPSPLVAAELEAAAQERERQEAAAAARDKALLYGGLGLAGLVVLGGVVAFLRR